MLEAPGGPAALWPAAAVEDGRCWWSGAGASYGGPVLPGGDPEHARAVVETLRETAAARGYETLRVTPPPPLYEPEERGVLRAALVGAGFRVTRSEVSQAARLDGRPVDEILQGTARRGARKAAREGVTLEPGAEPAVFHELLVADRARIGTSPVHSGAELADLVERLGERQHLCVARRNDEAIAGTWTLHVSDRVAVSFYVCQAWEHRRLRATNLLQRAAMEWAAERGAEIFDFGTTSVNGVLNEGLFAFKEAHGAETLDRETFELAVS
ncbi:MAG: GNAT family N-acetyltransferase [Gemmatimonadetes bacterium]|nr:GNAT family N-acetyltransferase [Gemmatimonadota bacterium]